MRQGSLFSGFGGGDLGFQMAGIECAWQVEINPFAQDVLAKHWPGTPRFGDICNVGKHNLTPVDILAGGFPCQPHSVAGKRAGAADERDLWPEYHRIICELEPRWIVAENVPGLLSTDDGRFFGGILRDLAGCGYDAEWDCISACALGAPHTRERVFVIAYPTGYRRQGHVFETVAQKVHDLSSQALGSWNGISDTQSYISKLMGTPGDCVLADGVSSTLAVRPALRGYGNAIVPVVFQAIGQALIELDAA